MKLKALLKDVKVKNAKNIHNEDINNVCISTKNVQEGDIFVCLKGQNFDGHNFMQKAKDNGAKVFIVEQINEDFDGVQIEVENTREALSYLARNMYTPNKKLKIIGITGTNGKTTTTHMLANILNCANKSVGIIGTEGIKYNGKVINLNMTTPDPVELFKYLKQMGDEGVEYVVMEVSAHAIYLNKINALKFYAKALTNITEDHLDFFKTMEKYSLTKLNFILEGKQIKVVNADDEMGNELAKVYKKIYTYSIDGKANAVAYNLSEDCSKYMLNLKNKILEIDGKVLGKYNVENALCASLLAKLMGIKDVHITNGLSTFNSVEGRMNIYRNGDKMVVVDFAHTPDAIKKLLTTIRPFTKGKLICLFGCGGNRDAQKRSIMGKIASEYSDYVYITNDNPRFEKPEDIANMIKSGINGNNYEIILDRKEAINKAVRQMQDGDVLLLCGKGAENYMEINGQKYDYSDKEEVEKYQFN